MKFLKTAERKALDFLFMALLPVFLILLWEYLSRKGFIRRSVLPPPSVIAGTFTGMVLTGEIFRHIGISLLRVVQGFICGAFAGVVFGILIGLSRGFEKAVALITGLLRPVPIIAWIPVLILWIGIDETSKVTVIAIGSFWPVLLNTIHGIRGTDKKFLELAALLRKSRTHTLFHVILPSALPAIFTGLRIGVGIAWMSVIAAELIAASSGIGYLIMYARELSQPDVMLCGVLAIGITGLCIDLLLRILEKRILKWDANRRNS